MATYIDGLTMIWALGLVIQFTFLKLNLKGVVAATCVGLYVIAQSGWTIAFLDGSQTGVEFNNYIWFAFNTSVMFLVTLVFFDLKANKTST